MILRTEISDLLSGFEKRMKFINIVRCLVDYKYPDAIREMMPNKQVLDNIIVSVLVFMNEKTLGNDQNCTLKSIEDFLQDLSIVLPEDCKNANMTTLSKYIVVDVLQNGGILNEYLTFDSAKEQFVNQPIRLINEEKSTYHLTDDAFDFLFRSKEIESELDYSVTRFRMKEYMKRNNYEEALGASRELVSRIKHMKISMDDFLIRCREDISKITIDQYDSVISRIRALLESEYDELTDIQNVAKEKAAKLIEAQHSGIENEETKTHRAALSEIIRNISQTIEEQRALINKKDSLSASYRQLLQDSFLFNRFERMNFEHDILLPMRKMNYSLSDATQFLLFMLTKPNFDNTFSVENFYAPQSKISEISETEGIDVIGEETDLQVQIECRNNRYLRICTDFFMFAKKKEQFTVGEFIGSLQMTELFELCEENALPNVMLSIFAMQSLDIDEWKTSERFTLEANGEFELSWCLEEIPDEYKQIKKINFIASNNKYSFMAQMNDTKRSFDITDFHVEVIR